MVIQVMFWLALSLIVHTYLVYPVSVLLLGLLRKGRPKYHSLADLPTVTVVVSVYNEGTVIHEKLKNYEGTDYPADKVTFLLGSDGSTDRTNEVLRRCRRENVLPHFFTRRRGKAAVLNDLVSESQGEIIVFSDANTLFQPDTVRKLVGPFSDPTVGAVCGELILVSDSRATGGVGERAYWRLENILKTAESRIFSTLGATGAVYAIRRSLFVLLPLDKTVMDDFVIPMGVLQKGLRVVYEPEAIAYEQPSASVRGEFQRRIRIAAANFDGISEYASLLLPQRGFVAFALWSHKILRWVAPFLFLAVACSTAFLAPTSTFYFSALCVGVAFLLVAAVGFALERLKIRVGLLGLPYYFVAINSAMMVGFFRYLFGRQKSTWEVIR